MAEYLSKHTEEEVISQNRRRKHWTENDTPETVRGQILEEHQEMREALDLIYLGDSATNLLAEASDVLYLDVKYRDIGGEQCDEVDQAVLEALEFCHVADVDPNVVVQFKLWRNAMKYDDYVQNNGFNPKEARQINKKSWILMGGDIAFSHAYLEIFGGVE